MAGIQSYIFGEGTPDTYESLQSKRKTAERFGQMAMRTPQNLGEGLSSLGQAIAYRRLMSQADKGDAKGRAEFNSVFQGLLGGMGGGSPSVSSMGGGGSPGGTWTPGQAPKVTDTPGMEGGTSFNMPAAPDPSGGAQLGFGSAAMTPQEMIIAGAEQRGLNPIDVATAISYETGGKFDPMIAGPTTQWGQHRGLIQFGEPQAQQYGADFSSPDAAMRSQLNPNDGAVWNYLDQTGVKPGMGLDNIYSAINAGAPGRFGASDANNGGAPGTVADKVAGMGDHRAKAAQFLGGTWTPATGGNVTMSAQNAPRTAPMGPQGGMGGINPAMIEALSNPYASEGQKMVLGALLQQQIAGMAPQDPLKAIQLQQAQLDLEQDMNPQPGTRLITGQEALDMGLPAGAYNMGADGKVTAIGGGGTTVVNNMGGNTSEFAKESDKAAAARFNDYIAGGATAQQMMGDVNALVQLAPQIGTGKGAEVMATLGPYAEALGIDVRGLDEAQAFKSIVDRMAPQMRPAGAGSSSDTDVKMFLNSLPKLGNTPEGNQIITQTLGAIQQHKIRAAEIASMAQMPKEQGGISWQEAEKQIRELGDPFTAFNDYSKKLPGTPEAGKPATRGAVTPQSISMMGIPELSQVDINSLDDAGLDALEARFNELEGGAQ